MHPYIVIEVKSLSVKTIRVEFHLLYECKFHMLDIMSSDRPRNWTQNYHTFQHISLSLALPCMYVCMYVCMYTYEEFRCKSRHIHFYYRYWRYTENNKKITYTSGHNFEYEELNHKRVKRHF